ncbi:hypothetical protein [Sulfurimonas sp.]|uniref:hypothetical protein n=1 Tax=Sulfurimonas sp. TaxID=2022749 RepID=UPI003D0D085A
MKHILVTFIFLFFIGCSDDGDVYITDQKILTTHIECMKLVVFPPNKEIESTLQSLYQFQDNCTYELIISYKTGIVCNSNQNFDKKVGGLPSSYLRMEIKKSNKLLYTYYKDLKEELSQKDVKNGFEVIQDDLDF